MSVGMGSQSVHCPLHFHTHFQEPNKEARGESKDERRTPGSLKALLPRRRAPAAAPVWTCRPGGRFPRLVLLVEPAVDEGPDQGAGRDTASETLAAQARVDAFFEAHRHRLSQGSHLRSQPYTSRPLSATDRSDPTRWLPLWRRLHPFRVAARREGVGGSAVTPLDDLTLGL